LPGEYRVEVIGRDAAGNWQSVETSSSVGWTVDTVRPETILEDPKLVRRSNNKTPSFSFSSEDGATFECKIDLAAYAPCTSPYTTAALRDGSHTFSVRAKDIAGNYDVTPATYTWTVDTAGPALTIRQLPLTNSAGTSEKPVVITGTKELGSTITAISFDTTATVTLTSNKDTLTTWSANATGLEETANKLTIIATDKAGNETSKKITIVYTKTAP
jgi:hypothetical protein